MRYHLPDWIMDGLASGSVERVEYGRAHWARIHMAYGATWDISTEVTPEILAKDYADMRRRVIESGGWIGPTVRLRVPIDPDKWRGIVYNSGE